MFRKKESTHKKEEKKSSINPRQLLVMKAAISSGQCLPQVDDATEETRPSRFLARPQRAGEGEKGEYYTERRPQTINLWNPGSSQSPDKSTLTGPHRTTALHWPPINQNRSQGCLGRGLRKVMTTSEGGRERHRDTEWRDGWQGE